MSENPKKYANMETTDLSEESKGAAFKIPLEHFMYFSAPHPIVRCSKATITEMEWDSRSTKNCRAKMDS